MGINGLSGIVRNEMTLDPLSKGIIYLFFNGRLSQIKMLQFDGDGHALYYKRLAREPLVNLFMILAVRL